MEDLGSFETLRQIIAKLRAPDGCPWDREQSHASIKSYLLEECYEALEALDRGDMLKLQEELGDLLMQILLHAQMAAEEEHFTVQDVIRGIADKLIRRHPHVFGDRPVADAREVEVNWEALKRQERGPEADLLDSVPRVMPALAYGQAIQYRAERAGWALPEKRPQANSVVRGLRRLKRARTPEERRSELGELLFSIVRVARQRGLEAEEALRLTNERFRRRFSRLEELCRERGLQLRSLSPQEQAALWKETKAAGN